MIHVYSQERDLVVYLFIYLFINQSLISYLLTFSVGGGGEVLRFFSFHLLVQIYLFLSLS